MAPRVTAEIEWRRDEWETVVKQAIAARTGKGLPKPPEGMPMPGHYVVNRDGDRWKVDWVSKGNKRTWRLGSASTEYADAHRSAEEAKRCEEVTLSNGWTVKVEWKVHRDELLPLPVWPNP